MPPKVALLMVDVGHIISANLGLLIICANKNFLSHDHTITEAIGHPLGTLVCQIHQLQKKKRYFFRTEAHFLIHSQKMHLPLVSVH